MKMKCLSKTQHDKKLCMNCKYSRTISTGYGFDYLCGKYLDNISESPKYSCSFARDSKSLCNGKEYDCNYEIVENDDIAASLNYNQELESWMPIARQIVENKKKRSPFSCGFLDRAIEKARLELSEK